MAVVYIIISASFFGIDFIDAVVGVFNIFAEADKVLAAKPFAIELMTPFKKYGFEEGIGIGCLGSRKITQCKRELEELIF